MARQLTRLVCQPSSCRNSKTARNLFRVSVLCSAPSSSRYRGVRHPPRVATRRRPATCSELACCVRRPHRVVIAGPNRCGRHPPRVAIAGSNRGAAASSCRNSKTARSLFRVSVLCSAASSSRYRWPKPLWSAPSSCRNSMTPPLGRAERLCLTPG